MTITEKVFEKSKKENTFRQKSKEFLLNGKDYSRKEIIFEGLKSALGLTFIGGLVTAEVNPGNVNEKVARKAGEELGELSPEITDIVVTAVDALDEAGEGFEKLGKVLDKAGDVAKKSNETVGTIKEGINTFDKKTYGLLNPLTSKVEIALEFGQTVFGEIEKASEITSTKSEKIGTALETLDEFAVVQGIRDAKKEQKAQES